MSQEAIDLAVATGRLPARVKPCRTERVPLVGAAEYSKTLAVQVGGAGCPWVRSVHGR